MEFTFNTNIDQSAMTAMARALRKTIRKKRSRRSHILGCIVAIAGLLLVFGGEDGFVVGMRSIVTLLALLVIVIALIWEDQINAYIAKKRMLPGTGLAASTFNADGYKTTTDIGETSWHYDKIAQLVKTKNYYVFVFNQSHAQVYDIRSLSGGSPEEFEKFIESATGKKLQRIG